MNVSVSGTIDQKMYLKKFRGASAPLAPPWIRLWILSQVVLALQVRNSKTHFNWQNLNKQHRLGERRPKQSLNQPQPIINDCQISIVQYRWSTKYEFKTK